MNFNHASLFSGIGGFDLAAQWMGWTNVFQVEKDEWCQSILAKQFPSTERYNDIKEFSGEKYRGSIDIISGGFPCQPFSVAGKQKGKSDDRYLWPEMLRVIREIKPTWIVGENVPGIISLALDQVYIDLENEGYTVQAFIIPAAAVNAIHKRDRVWILAHTKSGGLNWGRTHDNGKSQERPFCEDIGNNRNGIRGEIATSNTSTPDSGLFGQEIGQEQAVGLEQLRKERTSPNAEHNGSFTATNGRPIGNHARTSAERPNELQQFTGTGFVSNATGEQSQPDVIGEDRATQQIQLGRRNCQKPKFTWPLSEPTIRRGDDGVSYRLDDGRLITAKQRNNALKGLGNAVVPQLVYEIFRMVEKCNHVT